MLEKRLIKFDYIHVNSLIVCEIHVVSYRHRAAAFEVTAELGSWRCVDILHMMLQLLLV